MIYRFTPFDIILYKDRVEIFDVLTQKSIVIEKGEVPKSILENNGGICAYD